MNSELSNRLAIVTGGGTGLGRAIAVALAEIGMQVIVCGRRRELLDATVAEIATAGGSAFPWACDLTDPDAITAMAEEIVAQHGPIDLLVNNAGSNSSVRSARYIGAEEWRNVMDVNAMGPAMLTRAVLPGMVERRRGHIVLISSMAAINPGVMAGVAYSASKSAARIYMKTLASEVRQFGVRCTTVLPGEVDTPIMELRALPPNADARATMMGSEDVAAAVVMAVQLPARAMVSEIAMSATFPRDTSEELRAAMDKQS